jgi:prephenate dehydrogenase
MAAVGQQAWGTLFCWAARGAGRGLPAESAARTSVMPRTLHLIQPRRAAQSAAVIDKIAVVGLGCVGASLALAARERWPSALVIGVDANETIEKAMLRHAVDVASEDLGIVGDAGLVVLAQDEAHNAEALERLPRVLEGAAIVSDTAATKVGIVEAAKALPRRLTFIGGHPLVEVREGGIDAARTDLFEGSHWLLVPPDPPNDEAFDRLWRVVGDLGAQPASVSAVEHDRLMARLSQFPVLIVAGLLEVLGGLMTPDDLRFVGPPVTELARLLPWSSPEWRAEWRANASEIGALLDAFVESLRELRGHLTDDQRLDACIGRALAFRQKVAP